MANGTKPGVSVAAVAIAMSYLLAIALVYLLSLSAICYQPSAPYCCPPTRRLSQAVMSRMTSAGTSRVSRSNFVEMSPLTSPITVISVPFLSLSASVLCRERRSQENVPLRRSSSVLVTSLLMNFPASRPPHDKAAQIPSTGTTPVGRRCPPPCSRYPREE